MQKPKFKINWNKDFKEGFNLQPMNYEAETIHLMKVYGHTNTGRRFERPKPGRKS